MTEYATPAIIAADFDRDRWGRPLIVPPDGGKPRPYGRPSSFGKKLEDTYGLEQWQRRMVTIGLARTPSLVARAATVPGDPKSWTKAHKAELNSIAEEALVAARANQAADIGTSLHKMTELADLGEDVSHLPEPFATDVAAYRAGMAAHGLTILPQFVECRMVCDSLELAGTTDRIVWPDGAEEHRIYDLKTGESIELAALGYAVQLAIYAHSVLYDVVTGQRQELFIDDEVAYIGHLPAGKGTFTLHHVDIEAGWQAALLCKDIERWRKRKNLLVAVPEPAKAPSRPDPHHHAKTLSTPAAVTVTVAPEEGPTVDLDALRARYKAADEAHLRWIADIRAEAVTAGVDIHLADHPTMRRARIMDGLLTLVEAECLDDDAVRALVRMATGDDVAEWPTVPVGVAVGSMGAAEADAFAAACEMFVTGGFKLRIEADGRRRLVAA